MGTFCDAFARVRPLQHKVCQASNVKVVVRDLFATLNPLKLLVAINLLSPISNHRAKTWKLCIRSGR
jgi:hypothetical protein